MIKACPNLYIYGYDWLLLWMEAVVNERGSRPTRAKWKGLAGQASEGYFYHKDLWKLV